MKLTEATARSRIGVSGVSVALGGAARIFNSRSQFDYPTTDPAVPEPAAATPDVDVDELVQTHALPSEMVVDNCLFHGEWPIIGHAPAEEIGHLLLVGRCLDFIDDAYFIQDGLRFARLPGPEFLGRLDASTREEMEYPPYGSPGSSGWPRVRTLAACIEADSNDPYWEDEPNDLRSPEHAEVRAHLVAAFG